MQDLWLRDEKVGSRVITKDRSRFPGREKVGEVGKGGRLGEPATERRREYTDLWLDLGEKEEQVVCNASALTLAMPDEARREAEM